MVGEVFLFSGISAWLFFSAAFIFALAMKRNDLADVIWGPGFLVAMVGGWLLGNPSRAMDLRVVLAFLFVGAWAIRLFLHIGQRATSHTAEDIRYAQWRSEWGQHWIWRSYLQVFFLQGVFQQVICLPLLWIVASSPREIGVWVYPAALFWGGGLLIEAVADEQLRRFKAKPENRGKIIQVGLWRWSRHPNYFGEVVLWWGIFLLAIDLPLGLAAVISPLTISFLILKVSGVPMMERVMEKKTGWEQYKKRTSIFVPWPPKGF